MPSSRPETRFLDILDDIRLQGYVEGMDRVAFDADSRTRDAVERCLERVSEAATKLGRRLTSWRWGCHGGRSGPLAMSCGTPTIRSVRRSGDPARIWEIVTGDLPLMAEAAEAALLRLDEAQKS